MGRPAVELSSDERELLAEGLIQWGGPAHPTDQLAQVMGFSSAGNLEQEGARIARELRAGATMTTQDLLRALIATEFVFANDSYGAGADWSIVSGFPDDDTIRRLREIQRKFVRLAPGR
jgi:hypothetical protein